MQEQDQDLASEVQVHMSAVFKSLLCKLRKMASLMKSQFLTWKIEDF